MGNIKESYLSEVHKNTTEDSQTSLSSFAEVSNRNLGTKIAVVSDPTGGIKEVCDEYKPCLGMPMETLNEFRTVRSNLDLNDDTRRHNRATDLLNLEEKYLNHIRNNDKATRAVAEIVDRIQENDEVITLVCFEKQPKWCHRHILKQEIQTKLV